MADVHVSVDGDVGDGEERQRTGHHADGADSGAQQRAPLEPAPSRHQP